MTQPLHPQRDSQAQVPESGPASGVGRSLQRLKQGVRPPREELQTLARNLARALERERPEPWRQLLEHLAPSDFEDPYLQGYATALTDLSLLVAARLERREEAQRQVALAARSAWHPLLRLLEEPHTPTALADQLSRHLSSVSRTLKDLRAAGLVEVASPPGDGRQKLYLLSRLGRQVLAQLDEASEVLTTSDLASAPAALATGK